MASGITGIPYLVTYKSFGPFVYIVMPFIKEESDNVGVIITLTMEGLNTMVYLLIENNEYIIQIVITILILCVATDCEH